MVELSSSVIVGVVDQVISLMPSSTRWDVRTLERIEIPSHNLQGMARAAMIRRNKRVLRFLIIDGVFPVLGLLLLLRHCQQLIHWLINPYLIPTPALSLLRFFILWLRGMTPSDELEFEIQVQTVKEDGDSIHQLAGRKICKNRREGTGYLHSGRHGVDKQVNSGMFEDWVETAGERTM